jgi:hypothetical protein
MSNNPPSDTRTGGAKIVDAIAAGSTQALREALNGLSARDLQQIYVEINQRNAERQADSLPPVTVIVNDQDHDGRIDATGTNTDNGRTIAAEADR